jgi:hypothetical protein
MLRFGPEGVAEVARFYGIDLNVKKAAAPVAKKRRRTGDELRNQVVALRGRGLRPAAIADTLNIRRPTG